MLRQGRLHSSYLIDFIPLHNIVYHFHLIKKDVRFRDSLDHIKEASFPPTCCLLASKLFSWLI